jgi:hypothetical protein
MITLFAQPVCDISDGYQDASLVVSILYYSSVLPDI